MDNSDIDPKVKHHRKPNARATFIGEYVRARHPHNLEEGRKYFTEASAAWNQLKARQMQNPAFALLPDILTGAAGGAGFATGLSAIQSIRKNPRRRNPSKFEIGELVRVGHVGGFSPGDNSGVIVGEESSGGFLRGPAKYRVELPSGKKLVVPESDLTGVRSNPDLRRNGKRPISTHQAANILREQGFHVESCKASANMPFQREYLVARPGAKHGMMLSPQELIEKAIQ